MASDSPTDAEMKAAKERHEVTSRGYARWVSYVPALDAIDMQLRSGVLLRIPRALIAEFASATPAELDAIALTPSGSTITCEPLDVDISVPGIVREMTDAAPWLSRAGGKKSAAKTAAVRVNGAKGGRPRKNAAG